MVRRLTLRDRRVAGNPTRRVAALLLVCVCALASCDGGDTDSAEVPATDGIGAEPGEVGPIAQLPPTEAAPQFVGGDSPPLPNPIVGPVVQTPSSAPNDADIGPIVVGTDTSPLLAVEADEELLARIATADPDAGWRYGQRCAGCHSLAIEGPGAGGPQVGPALAGVVQTIIGGVESFAYTAAFDRLRETGIVWDVARLDVFLANPAAAIPGTAMAFAGIADPIDRANVIAFLVELSAELAATAPTPVARGVAERVAGADADLGRSLAVTRCGNCHRFDPAAVPLVGPNLFGILGDLVGRDTGFAYSPALLALKENGVVWTYDLLDAFLQDPALAIPGTRMGFTGVNDPDERANIIGFLRLLSVDPYPFEDRIGLFNSELNPIAFTSVQASRGNGYYEAYGCGNCHGADLRGDIDISGFGDAPPLTGAGFERRWFARVVFELLDYIRSEKQPADGEEIDNVSLTDLVAFVLEQNGFRDSETELPADREPLEAMGFYQ